jgi:hypothetical protein
MTVADFIGVCGVFLCLLGYTLNLLQRLSTDGWLYPTINGVSSVLILISLASDFNLASVLMEGSWLCVSVYGTVIALARRQSADAPIRS